MGDEGQADDLLHQFDEMFNHGCVGKIAALFHQVVDGAHRPLQSIRSFLQVSLAELKVGQILELLLTPV